MDTAQAKCCTVDKNPIKINIWYKENMQSDKQRDARERSSTHSNEEHIKYWKHQEYDEDMPLISRD